jgi:site-specific recombinase XerD
MKGIRRDRYGFRVYVKVGGVQREQRFKPDATIEAMKNWQDECRLALRKLPSAPVTNATFKADARTYLALPEIKTLGSYKSRVCEIEAWYPHIGAFARRAVTRAHILAARSIWIADGFASKTINHRLRALRHLYRTLDGKKAPTPADDVDRLPEPPADPRFVPVRTLRSVAKKLADPQTRARFMVLAATGMRPAQLRRAVRTDVNLRTRVWLVRPAKGGNPIPMALTDDMLVAWRAFIAADAFGPFDGSDYARAVYAAGWDKVKHGRPYNAKHTIAITLGESGAEWEDIKDFFGHTDIKTTRIYTGLLHKRLRGTAARLQGRIGWK